MIEPGVAMAVLARASLLIGLFIGHRVRPPPMPAKQPAPLPPLPPRDVISIETLVDPALIVEGFTAIAANTGAREMFGQRIAGSDWWG